MRRRLLGRFLIALAMGLLAVAGAASFASAQGVPHLLSQQGRVLDANNLPIGGLQNMTFTIYDGPESNTVLWFEAQPVAFDNGFYSLTLGRTNAIPENLFDGSDVYLGVRIGDDDEMRPRMRITSVPYAFKAGTAENVVGDITPNSISVGGATVINEAGEWVGSTAGLQGAAGPQGPQGPEGPEGPAGGGADANDVAALLAMDANFRDAISVLLVGNYADSLRGADGAPGAQGPEGPQGPPGTAADSNAVASALAMDGAFRDALAMVLVNNYAAALRGLQGPAGVDGAPGAPGADGAQGPPGPAGAQGDPGPAGQDGQPSGGLVAQYEFDEETGTLFADTSVLGNDATTTGGGLTAGSAGHTGNTVDFSGGILTVAAGNTIPDSAQIWVEAWINPDVSANANQVVLQKEGAYSLFKVADGNAANDNGFQIGFTVTGRLGACTITHPEAFIAGQWTHVAGWYTNLRLEVAVNGNIVTSDCANGAIVPHAGSRLFIGARLSGANRVDQFDGRIDEVRIRQTAPVGQGTPATPFSGSVLLSPSQQVKLNKWTGKPGQTWRRCYRLTTDGASSTTFHNQCDNSGPSFSVFKVGTHANGQARLFGGYTENAWSASYGYRGYDDAFLFVLEPTIERFDVGYTYSNTTYSHISYGPTFGHGHDIYVNASMQLAYCNFPYAFSCDQRTLSGLQAGPTTPCTQRLCGLNTVGTTYNVSFQEMEVWVLGQ